VAFDNITLYSTPAFAFGATYNIEPQLFRNITIRPPLGSGRLVSNFGDGIHSRDNRYGQVIEGCYFTYGMDDTVAQVASAMPITGIISANTFTATLFDSSNRVGDKIQFVDHQLMILLGTATITGINGTTFTVDALPGGVAVNHIAYNLSRSNAGYVIQNNTIGIKRRFAGILYCGIGRVLNNLVDGNAGFWIGTPTDSDSGTFTENILFQGNTIRNTDYGLWIHTGTSTPQGHTLPLRDFRILDNVFGDNVNIDINMADNVLIQGNQFFTTPIATLGRVTNVTIGHNIGANGNFIQDEMGSLQGGYAPSEITIIPYQYSDWAAKAGLIGEAALATYDADFDGMDNQLEYALGGNPLVNDAANVRPSCYTDSGDWLYYVFEKRNDPSLIYSVQSSTDLVSGTWTSNGVELVSESAMLNNFKTVTYRVPIAGKPRQFVRLKVD
jgi:hypothetical protein